MRRILSFLLITFFGISAAVAQQRPQYSQYSLNNYLVNPAIGGIENYSDVKMGFRKQWAGLEGAPQTMYASFHTSIGNEDRNRTSGRSMMRGAVGRSYSRTKVNRNNKFHRARPHHGIGATIQRDQTGPIQNTSMTASYAFHLPVTQRIKVSMGAAGGFNQFTLNRRAMTTVVTQDPALYSNRLNSMKLDMGLGTWVYSDNFFVGLSAMDLLANTSGKSQVNSQLEPNFTNPHIYLTGGYRFYVSNDLTLIPSAMVKYSQPATAVDINLKAMAYERVWAGVSYRHQDAVSVMAGVSISPTFDISYSYDAVTSELRNASSGSHEIVVGLKLRNRAQVFCPQWMW
jgi:type IX secretion system PorP/SprF family membrane protein